MTVKELAEKCHTDPEFHERFSLKKPKDELYKNAKECGITMDEETFFAEVKKYVKSMNNLTEKDAEGIAAAGSDIYFFDSSLFSPHCR